MAIKLLRNFMNMSEGEVVRKFMELPGSKRLATPYGDAVYVKPKPLTTNPVLLVAHYDTVWRGETVRPVLRGGVFESGKKGIGIGADDRAGIAALWELRDSGHAMIIVPEEETGCRGSGHVAKHHPELLAEHAYAIQFDRKGASDLVFYDCDNPDFEDYLMDNFMGYRVAQGSFSDICELCPAGGIAGVNISIGFRNEHTEHETLDVADWRRTVEKVKCLLGYEQPRFEYIEAKNQWNLSLGDLDEWGMYECFCPECFCTIAFDNSQDCICPNCGTEMDEYVWT